jgi:hypothetical protein
LVKGGAVAAGEQIDEPRLMAAVDMARRTGAREVQIRYSDDEQPVVWMVVAGYSTRGDGVPRPTGKVNRFRVGAGLSPLEAAMALLNDAVDGAICTHCGRPTGITGDFEGKMPLDEYICWYRYDPELKTFRRDCEGDT